VSSWIVNNVPAWLLLSGLMVVVAGSSVLIQIHLRRRFPALREDAHNDVTRFAFGVIGFVYGFFIGFLVNAMWSQVNSADAKAATEGSAAMQLAKDLTAFDKADSDRIRQSLLEYERAAAVEWTLVAGGQSYPEAENALHRLYTAYQKVQPSNATQSTFLVMSLNNLEKKSVQRTERVIEALTDVGPPWSLWAVVFLTSGMVLGCAIIYGGKKPGIHYTMTATIGALLASNLFLLLELSHPYLGEIATSPQPLLEVIRFLES
jgi:hypothetical protein